MRSSKPRAAKRAPYRLVTFLLFRIWDERGQENVEGQLYEVVLRHAYQAAKSLVFESYLSKPHPEYVGALFQVLQNHFDFGARIENTECSFRNALTWLEERGLILDPFTLDPFQNPALILFGLVPLPVPLPVLAKPRSTGSPQPTTSRVVS